MNIITCEELAVVETPHGVDVRKVFESEHVQVMEIKLMPGESLRKHATPVDVFFYVLEGEGMVEIGDERETVHADQLIESPMKVPHRLLNEGDAPFRFLVVKTPAPKESARLL